MDDDLFAAVNAPPLDQLQARPHVQNAVKHLRKLVPANLVATYRTQGALVFDSFDEYRRALGEGFLTDQEWLAAVEKLAEME